MGRRLTTPTRKKETITTETKTRTRDVTMSDGVVTENVNTQLDQCAKQRMMPKPLTKLFTAKTSVKIRQWNVQTMANLTASKLLLKSQANFVAVCHTVGTLGDVLAMPRSASGLIQSNTTTF